MSSIGLSLKNFSNEKIFGGHLSHLETQLHAKKSKKILNGQCCRTGTDGRTDERTDESEFMFLSDKSREPKRTD